jgi:ddrB-like ParB superfamily domain
MADSQVNINSGDWQEVANSPAAAPAAAASGSSDWQEVANPKGRLAPGMSDDDIIRSYGYDPSVVKKSHLYSSGDFSSYISDPNRHDWVSKIADSPVGDMGYGILGTANGAAQLITHALHKVGVASDADKQYVDLMTRVSHDDYTDNVRHGKPRTAGQIIGTMMVPVPGGTALKATAGGAMLGAMQPVDVQGPDGDYWKTKSVQTAAGAGTGLVTHGVITGIGKGIGVAIDKAIAKKSGQIPADAQEILDLANQHEIDGVTYGDVTGSPTGKVVDTTLENIPGTGAGSQRGRQQTQVKAAATRVSDKLQSDFQDLGFQNLDQVQAKADAGDGEARKIVEAAQSAGDDPDRAAQVSLQIGDYLSKQQNRANYAQVGKIAEELPNNDVEPTRSLEAIDQTVADINARKLPTGEKTRMVKMFEGLRENLKDKANPYATMRSLSDELGAQISDYYNGRNAVMGAPGVQWLQRVKSAVDGDLDHFVQTGGKGNEEAAAAAAVPTPEGPGAPAGDAGTAQQGAAVQEQAGGGAQPAPQAAAAAPRTSEARLTVPGEDTVYPGQYELREAGDVQPSHNAQTFAPNPKFKLVNDRQYNNPVNQEKVTVPSTDEKFDPAYHITDNPDATNGPSIIDKDNQVLGGNGRMMMLQRIYAAAGKAAARYRQMLTERAAQFGIDPAEVAKFKNPVLVRVLDESAMTPEAKQIAITDFNKTGTASLTPAEQAIRDSRRVSPETLKDIGGQLDALGPEGTLAQVIEGQNGRDIMQRLIQDGVVSPQERAGLMNEKELTKAGKERLSQLLLGRFFKDPAQLDNIPAAARGKIERIAAHVVRTESEGNYTLTPHVQSAIDLLEQMRTRGTATVDDYLNQTAMHAGESYTPEAVELAKQIRTTNPNDLVDRVRTYADRAAQSNEGPGLFGDPVKSPREAFNEAFGTELSGEGGPPPAEAPQAPAKSADFEQSFKPAPKPINPQDTLDRLRAASKLADEFYKSDRVPYSDQRIGNAIKTDEPDTIFGKFIQSGKGDRAQKFYDRLDPKGKAAVRYGIVAQAIDKATSTSDKFSPAQFVAELDRLKDAQGVFFKGRDKWELDGFTNLMSHLKRAGQYGENPPTGARLIPYVLAGGALSSLKGIAAGVGIPTSGTAIGSIALARLLFTTAAGRDFLLRASVAKPGTRMMESLVEGIDRRLASGAAATASRETASNVLEFPKRQNGQTPAAVNQ